MMIVHSSVGLPEGICLCYEWTWTKTYEKDNRKRQIGYQRLTVILTGERSPCLTLPLPTATRKTIKQIESNELVDKRL